MIEKVEISRYNLLKNSMLTTQSNNRFKILVVALIVLTGAVVFGKAVLADGYIDARETVAVQLSNYLDKHPDAELARQLATWLVPSKEEVQGILFDQKDESPISKVCFRDSDGAKCIVTGWEEFPLPSTTVSSSEKNLLGFNAYIDYAESELLGPVSSTFNLFLGVTTTANVPYNASATAGAVPNNLIDGTEYVTSTAPVQFVNGNKVEYRNLRNSMEDQGTSGNQVVRFSTSTLLTVFLQSDEAAGSCTAGACEEVTSTIRGFTGFIRYRYHYSKSL